MSSFPALCGFFYMRENASKKKEKRTAKKCSKDTIEINKKEQTCVEVEI